MPACRTCDIFTFIEVIRGYNMRECIRVKSITHHMKKSERLFFLKFGYLRRSITDDFWSIADSLSPLLVNKPSNFSDDNSIPFDDAIFWIMSLASCTRPFVSSQRADSGMDLGTI